MKIFYIVQNTIYRSETFHYFLQNSQATDLWASIT